MWDYAGDGFVHRLVMNKLDGKMIELPAPADGGTGAAGMRSQQPTHTDAVEEGMQKEKLESIALVRRACCRCGGRGALPLAADTRAGGPGPRSTNTCW